MMMLYNLVIMAGCGYVVFGLDHSGWWFLLAIVVLFSHKDLKNCPKCGAKVE